MSPAHYQVTAKEVRPLEQSPQNGGVVIGLLGWLMFFFLVAVPVIKMIPLYNEYLVIKRAVSGAYAVSVGVEQFERAVARLLDDENFHALGSDGLEFTHDDSGTTRVRFSYIREMHLYGPVSLKIRFSGTAGR